jgi:hypothetical protein
MVSDDDTEPREPIVFRSQPVDFLDPDDEEISTAIVQLARQEPSWGRRRILETLWDRGFKIEQAHVNHVLRKHDLPNLYL